MVLQISKTWASCATGGPGKWSTRTYSGGRNLGSSVDGKPLLVSSVRKLEDALIVSDSLGMLHGRCTAGLADAGAASTLLLNSS